MKHNISLTWHLFGACGDTGVTVSPTLGNFVPKFSTYPLRKLDRLHRSLVFLGCHIHTIKAPKP